ncbi:hypothetical protein M408DRAFT_12297 [Serendipita vermifera MAFF 305830]|uniref:RNase III domain-containing protein n=1 Tax=Serendipita vermifera MAFF 305830 TaxID=933852 RepID=A0A0C3ARN6_SERVB|nr:hypothetical protein M408DRAFT_12297 [Serendipita vermifera MAFF 305830]
MGLTDDSLSAALPSEHNRRFNNGACRPPQPEVDKLPKLVDFKYVKTRTQVFTHRSYYARPTAVFEDPPDDIAPDNEVLEFVGDSVLSLAVATLVRETYPGLRVGPHAKIKALVVQNATIAHISEHYLLAQNLRANSSQLVSLRHSPVVQGASIGSPYGKISELASGYSLKTAPIVRVFDSLFGSNLLSLDSSVISESGTRYLRLIRWKFGILTQLLTLFFFDSRFIRGGLYVDWGYEHIRPWLFRVLRPYVDEAYRIVQRDYLDPSPNKRLSAISKPFKGGSPGSSVIRTPPAGKPPRSSFFPSLPDISSSLKPIAPTDIQANMMHIMTPQSLASSSVGPFPHRELPPESAAPPSYSPPVQPSPQARRFAPSAVAEGHLPLLNQVLQHAKRWIDWDYELDPKSPSTTPIWDASGKMSGVEVCTGRGNTKKLAKNDAARELVGELQARLGRSGGTTPELAQELEKWYSEKQGQSQPTIYEQEEDEQIIEQGMNNLNFGRPINLPYQPSYSYYGSPRHFGNQG